MNYKVKLAAVRRFESAMRTTVQRYYTDDVGHVRHTPSTYYWVLKRNLKQKKAKYKRSELRRFAKVAFLVANSPDLQRRGVEIVFDQIISNAFLISLLADGFCIATSAIKKVLAKVITFVQQLLVRYHNLLDRLVDDRLFITLKQLLF